jgi:transcriptional regulator NrdR family protein
MMACPACGHDTTAVKDSRPTEGNTVIRRMRMCPSCHKRFTTYESVWQSHQRHRGSAPLTDNGFERIERAARTLRMALDILTNRPIE